MVMNENYLLTKDEQNFYEGYKKSNRKKNLLILILFILVIVFSIVSVLVGSSNIGFIESLKGIFMQGSDKANLIVWNIRMPRLIAAIIAGFGLAAAGTVMQGVLKNPMVSPSTLGVSNAAVFGANIAISVVGAGVFHSTDGTSLTISNPYLVSSIAFLFAFISVLLILFLSKFRKFSPETIVLSGVAIGTLFSAGTTLVQYFSLDTQVAAAVYWSFGDLSRATYSEDLIMFIIVGISFIIFYILRHKLNALSSGEENAKSLGVNVELVRFIVLLLSSLITAVCVSFLGVIGFIGLAAPQIIKRIIGNNMRFTLFASSLFGSVLLLVCDTLARVIIPGSNLPVGAVTAMFGAPIFIFILFNGRRHRG